MQTDAFNEHVIEHRRWVLDVMMGHITDYPHLVGKVSGIIVAMIAAETGAWESEASVWEG